MAPSPSKYGPTFRIARSRAASLTFDESVARVGREVSAMQDKQIALTHFYDLVKSAHENQYGDFMRRVNAYVGRLEESLGAADARAARVMGEIRERLMFKPNFDIESTRSFVLRKAAELA